MIRVLLVDDQELVRAGLRAVLRRELGFAVVGECGDGAGVPAAAAALRPGVVLMDVRMPRVDGVSATRRLRADPAAPPVLALTTFDDDEALAGMLRAGAAGFLLKGVAAEELHRAVRAVAAGDSWLDPAVTGRVLATYRASRGTPRSGAAAASTDLAGLTSRERDVLTGIGRGLTNAEIARELFLGEGTVKTHVSHLFAKLGLRDRAAAVVLAFDADLVTPGGRPPG